MKPIKRQYSSSCHWSRQLAALACCCFSLVVYAEDAKNTKDHMTLYIRPHVSIEVIDNGDDSNTGVSSNSSMIGVKGDFASYEGVQGFYHVEWHLGLGDDGGKNLVRRDQYVGLRYRSSEMLIGRMNTPMKVLGRKVDLFYSSQLGENRSITATSGSGGGYDARFDNVILMRSVSKAKLHWAAAYYSDANLDGAGDRTDDNDNKVFSGSIGYNGPQLWIGFGYEWRDGDAVVPAVEDQSAIRLSTSYKFGANRLVGFWESAADINGSQGRDRDIFGIGYAYTQGKLVYKTAVYMADDLDDSANTGGTQITLGVDKKLNKRTTVYVVAAHLDNDDGAKFAITGKGHDGTITVLPGDNNFGFALGILHNFSM